MIVITVARKPLSGTVAGNALQYGTGGINIDACRIHTTENLNGGTYAKTPSFRTGTWVEERPGDRNVFRRGSAGDFQQPTGRWPANLILSHLGGCQRDVVRYAQRSMETGGRTSDNRLVYGKGLGTGFTTAHKETVETWACQAGCPVGCLDAQSGIVPTGTWNRQKDTAHPFGNAKNTPYETWREPPKESPGGASRFFKQVQSQKSEE